MEKTDVTSNVDDMSYYDSAESASSGIVELVNGSVEKIKNIESKIKETMECAQQAKDKSNGVRKVGFFNKGSVIDDLKSATKDIAQAMSTSADTQRLLFEHQQVLATACKKLFEIGVSNITATQSTIRAIEMKMSGASKEELSTLARTELLNVVRQLKSQEDIMQKQSLLGKKVKGIDVSVIEQNKKIDNLELEFQENNDKQNIRLNEKDSKDLEHDKRLDENDLRDIIHDQRLAQKDAKDREHDLKIQECLDKISALEKNLKSLSLRNTLLAAVGIFVGFLAIILTIIL